MKILLSPAKKQNLVGIVPEGMMRTIPFFQEDKKALFRKIEKLSPEKLTQLYKIPPQKAAELFTAYHAAEVVRKQALLTYSGIVFQSMVLDTWTMDDYEYARTRTYIMSALYGALRTTDIIRHYRLDMGHKIYAQASLNHFWKNKIELLLKDEPLILNLASAEFTHSLDLEQMIGFTFLDEKDGVYKKINTYVKMARGKMYREIIQKRARTVEEIKALQFDGYIFDAEQSSSDNLVYKRASK